MVHEKLAAKFLITLASIGKAFLKKKKKSKFSEYALVDTNLGKSPSADREIPDKTARNKLSFFLSKIEVGR